MMIGVVEEVALDAPGLAILLPPHLARLDVDQQRIQLERTLPRLRFATARGRLFRARHHPLLAFAVEQFLTVERHREVVVE